MDNFLENYPTKKWFKKPKFFVPLILLIIVIFSVSFFNKDEGEVAGEKIITKNVKTTVLDKNRIHTDQINTAGIVKADTKVDIIAMVNGTVRSANFKTGDIVRANTTLASLYDSTLLTNMGNAQANFSNTQQSYTSAQRLADESVRQAQQNIDNAEIGLKAAQDNLANISELQTRAKEDSLNNAVISYFGYLNTIQSALDQVEYILDVDDDYTSQLPGLEHILGVKNTQSIRIAESAYLSAKKIFDSLPKTNVNEKNIVNNLINVANNLNLVKQTIDATIVVLDNTVTNVNFSDSTLIAQKNIFINLRSNIVNTQTVVQSNLQNLQNIDLVQKRELDALQNALEAAENQLLRAHSSFINTEESKRQQLISAQTALDASQGQVNLIGSQVADLTIKAPISGQITQKSIELGTEVRAGQKIAEISQTGLVKIELSLTSEDVYRIELGQIAMINNDLGGVISHIDPAADPMTKKVKVEIAFDNKDKQLIPETFVDVAIYTTGNNANSVFSADSFLVPLKAVTITQTEKYVFLAKEGKATKTMVEIGQTEGDKVEIISGLNDGDELIIEGNRNLEGDEEIEIINN